MNLHNPWFQQTMVLKVSISFPIVSFTLEGDPKISRVEPLYSFLHLNTCIHHHCDVQHHHVHYHLGHHCHDDNDDGNDNEDDDHDDSDDNDHDDSDDNDHDENDHDENNDNMIIWWWQWQLWWCQ